MRLPLLLIDMMALTSIISIELIEVPHLEQQNVILVLILDPVKLSHQQRSASEGWSPAGSAALLALQCA